MNEASVAELNAQLPPGRPPLTPLHFRPNIVLRGCAAFAEDRWRRLQLGAGEILLAKPCGRCVVPSIDPATGVRAGDAQPLIHLRKTRLFRGEGCFGVNALPLDPAAPLSLAVGTPVFVTEWQSSPFA